MEVKVIGSRAYVTSEEPALHVVDVSAPSAPTELGSVALPEPSLSFDVVGGRAYVAAGYAGLRIIDVSDPAAPVEVGAYATVGFAPDVAVHGSFAYVGDSVAGLRIVDVSDPTSPSDLGGIRHCAYEIEVLGRLAYCAGPMLFDVSAAPSLHEILHLPDFLEHLEPAGRFLYGISDEEFRVLDLGPEYVPEPAAASLAVVALSAVAWLVRRRRPGSVVRPTQRSSGVNTTGMLATPRTKGESV
jgi:uncharacterized protein (TIGR03382 family)